jgi:predicted hotdog family 3-hydroxylacyl-ACP dehydratase
MHLDRPWIEQHIPHHGRMCLLDEVMAWDAQHILCRSGTHGLPDHPLRARGALSTVCGIEYAAQTMAVHGALKAGALRAGVLATDTARAEGGRPDAGFLAALRDVRLHVLRLDDIAVGLTCEATLIAGDGRSALYEFALRSEAQLLLSGRATVIFDANTRLNT